MNVFLVNVIQIKSKGHKYCTIFLYQNFNYFITFQTTYRNEKVHRKSLFTELLSVNKKKTSHMSFIYFIYKYKQLPIVSTDVVFFKYLYVS